MTSSTLPDFLREQAKLVLAQRPVFLDTETTGLGENDTIIEIAILDTDGSKLFESLVRPRSLMDAEVIAIHGITNEELADAPTWAEIAPQVARALHGRCVVAHYAPFDQGMVRGTAAVAGVTPPEPAAWFCSMQLMLHAVPDAERVSLARSMRIAGATDVGVPGKAHRAAYDAECCRRLLLAVAGKQVEAQARVA